MPQMWQVVGGADRGGILVRQGQELSSEKLPERLSTGAIVAEMDLVGERLHYRRVTGKGPEDGWIGVALEHKELARRLPPVQIKRLPRVVMKDLKWLLWNELCRTANSDFAAQASGEARSDALEDAEDSAMCVAKYADAVEASEFFAIDELGHLREQARGLGSEAAEAAAQGRPLAEQALERLKVPPGFAEELWNRMLKALLTAGEYMRASLQKNTAESSKLQTQFEPLWDVLGAEQLWYEAAGGPLTSSGDSAIMEDGVSFRVVVPRAYVRSHRAGGRNIGVLNRGTLVRGEVQAQQDGRDWLRLPRELNRGLLESDKWQGPEAWINLSEGRPLASVGSPRDKGFVIMGCTHLYSHVKYFARLGEWLRERGHEVQLWTIETEKTRQAAEEHLPQKCLRLLGERAEDKDFWGIWEQVSRDGNASQESFDQFFKSAGYMQYFAGEAVKNHHPTMVVTDGWDATDFNNSCYAHAGARATVTCPARKDGLNDTTGAEPFPTLYPTVPGLFDGEMHPTTILCGPFLPPVEKLERVKYLEEGTPALQQWCSSDSRPIIYISFGTVAVLQEEFLRRFTRAILVMCGEEVPEETTAAKNATDTTAEDVEDQCAIEEGEWLVLHETSCGLSEQVACTIQCGSSPKEIRQCRQLCRLEGYGGFCIFDGEAEFWRSEPSQIVARAEVKEHSVLHFPAEATLGKAGRSSASKASNQSKPKFRFLWSLPLEQQKLLPQEALRPSLSQNLRIERFVPQQAVLRLQNVAACITHCGANSSHEALACGVPMVCVPFFMDQFDWCRAVVRRGVGVPVDRRSASARDVQEAVELAVERCAEGARKLGIEIRQFLRDGSGLERAGHLCLRAMGYE